MSNQVRIASLQVENTKRVEFVLLELDSKAGLTVIGGNNSQGKSSVLDAGRWLFGGDRYKPTKAVRDGAEKVNIMAKLNNGMVVERVGKNGTLRVTTKDGKMGGQNILKEFVTDFSLDIQSFMDLSDKEKAKALLKALDVDLDEVEALEKAKYDERTTVGRDLERAKAAHAALPDHEGVPEAEETASDVAGELQEALAHNAKVQEAKSKIEAIKARQRDLAAKIKAMQDELESLGGELFAREAEADDQVDISALQLKLSQVETVNAKVRDNKRKAAAAIEAQTLAEAHTKLTEEIEEVRRFKLDLLTNAKLPLAGLSVDAGALTYNGKLWDCMSHSEQLRVATAISKALNPACGFVFIDKLEAMDVPTLKEFAEWAEENEMQIITTRVSTGPECSFIIEAGKVKE